MSRRQHRIRHLDGPPSPEEEVLLALAGECPEWLIPESKGGGLTHRLMPSCPYRADFGKIKDD